MTSIFPLRCFSEILPVKGVTLVGPLPADIQNFTVSAAGIGAAARDGTAATGFVGLRSGPEAAAVLRERDMEPLQRK